MKDTRQHPQLNKYLVILLFESESDCPGFVNLETKQTDC